MKFLLIFFLLIISCKPSPTYNPFDDQFDVSINEIVEEGCDTIFVCGNIINLQEKKGRLRSFYQVQIEKNEVEAKGFSYFLDTIVLTKESGNESIGSLKISKQSVNYLNSALKKYNYIFLDHYKGNKITIVRLLEKDTKDTLRTDILWEWVNEKDSIIERKLEYWNPVKLNK